MRRANLLRENMPNRLSEFAQRVLAHIDENADLFYGPVVQLLQDNERGMPSPVGTGLLLAVDEQMFLISAAHVLDHVAGGGDMWFSASEGRNCHLAGALRIKVMPKKDRKQDAIDVGVLKLLPLDWPSTLRENCRPITRSCFLPSSPRKAGAWCIPVGFPASKTKLNTQTKSASAQPYASSCPAIDPTLYAKHGLVAELHVAMSFDLKNVVTEDGQRQKHPDMDGMSGSPVWMLTHESDDELHFSIVGVLTGHRRKDRLLVATDIGVAIELIDDLLAT